MAYFGAPQKIKEKLEKLQKMKALIAYYSRHGHTKKAGERIAKLLGAETEEIIDKKDRSNLFTWFLSSFDEELKAGTKIEKTKHNPADFDIVIVGTPIWSGITPAVRKYLEDMFARKLFICWDDI